MIADKVAKTDRSRRWMVDGGVEVNAGKEVSASKEAGGRGMDIPLLAQKAADA